MKIGTMRSIDYWLGVPLCFFLSGFNFFAKIFSFKAKRKNAPPRILFIKLSELGAIALAYPLFTRIKEEYPSAELFFVTFEKSRDIFKLLKGVVADENVLGIRDDSIGVFILDTFKVIKRLRREKFDIVFDLDFFSRFTAILAYLAKADKRAGFYRYTFEGLYRGSLLTHKFQYNPLNHVSKTYLSLSQAARQERKDTPESDSSIGDKEIVLPQYISEGRIQEAMRERLKASGINAGSKLFLLNPGEGLLPLREWPLDNFIALSKRLLEDKNNYIIIIGKDEAFKKGELILKAAGASRCLNFSGKTSLEELMGLFNIAEALISNDCGLAHLAMLSPVKKFVIFGPESPQVFGPLGKNNWIIYSNWPCSPCLSAFNHRKSSCRDNKCLKAINPEDVYRLIKKACEN